MNLYWLNKLSFVQTMLNFLERLWGGERHQISRFQILVLYIWTLSSDVIIYNFHNCIMEEQSLLLKFNFNVNT